jgi:hypothetical protein
VNEMGVLLTDEPKPEPVVAAEVAIFCILVR